MAVILNNIEMPECCFLCLFGCWSNLHQTEACYLMGGMQMFNDYSTEYRARRSASCPMEAVRNQPPVQQEDSYDEWCTDCKEYDHERHCCPRWNRVIRDTLQDVQTEREKTAIAEERFADLCDYFGNKEETIIAILYNRGQFKAWLERMHWHVVKCDKMQKELDALKAKQKNGTWARDGHHIRCDQCGMYMCDIDREGDRIPTGFCPNCGAKMEEDES